MRYVTVSIILLVCFWQSSNGQADGGSPVKAFANSAFDQYSQIPLNQSDSRNSTTMDRIVQLYSTVLSVNSLTGNNGEYQFKASLFTLGNVLNDSAWNVDTVFLSKKNDVYRNSEISVGLKMGQNGVLSGINPSFKYAVINNRERAKENFFNWINADTLSLLKDIVDNYLAPALENMEKVESVDPVTRKRLELNLQKCMRSLDFSTLDTSFANHIPVDLIQRKVKSLSAEYDSLAKVVDGRAQWLWTVGGNFPKGKGDSLFIRTEYYHGIFQGTDFILRGTLSFQDTSSVSFSKFERETWQVSAGSDFILLRDQNRKTLIDLNAFLEFDGVTKGLLKNEDKNPYNIGFTLSPVVSTSFSVPITVKYDPKNGNFLGLLELQWNFKSIRSATQSKGSQQD